MRSYFSMPTIQPSSVILVTGGNGIGSRAVHHLLDEGFLPWRRVDAKAAEIEPLFRKETVAGCFRIVIVLDLCAERAFDVHVVEVDAVVHTAHVLALLSTGAANRRLMVSPPESIINQNHYDACHSIVHPPLLFEVPHKWLGIERTGLCTFTTDVAPLNLNV